MQEILEWISRKSLLRCLRYTLNKYERLKNVTLTSTQKSKIILSKASGGWVGVGCYNRKWMLYHLDERLRNGEPVIIDNIVKFITIKPNTAENGSTGRKKSNSS